MSGASDDRILAGRFNWEATEPLVGPAHRPQDTCYSVKDPSLVFFEEKWHLFCSIRSEKRSHQIEYLNFENWDEADRSERHILSITDGYFCAPQVFFHTEHGLWYLLYQVVEQSRKPALQPACSTTRILTDPSSWSPPKLLFDTSPQNIERWIDFWIICDESKAHLFFTSLDGRMWRSETSLQAFPHGWDLPEVVLTDDIYEAGHTYRLKGLARLVTVLEAVAEGRRYFKAYLADRLDGNWEPVAASLERPFASPANVKLPSPWTDSFSHGEFLRDGFDQSLTIDTEDMQFLFQGVRDEDREGKKYGLIPWRLGILKPLL
jgi:hypothetical protein